MTWTKRKEKKDDSGITLSAVDIVAAIILAGSPTVFNMRLLKRTCISRVRQASAAMKLYDNF
jgi:hypothetical protein